MSMAARNNNDPPRLVLAGAARDAETPDAISAWLDVFVRLLRFPEAERAGVREELESHLRERVRDLVLTDVNEVEAQRRAIAELGDAAELAQRYVAAKRTPTRRLVMNGLVAAAAGVALITSIVAVNHTPPTGSHAVEYQPSALAAANDPADNKVAARRFDKVALRDVLAAIAAEVGRPLTLNEAALGQTNIDLNTPITLGLESGDLALALRRINGALPEHQGMLDWRLTAAQLEVATREHFDRMETKLISLELGNYFSLPQSTPQAVVELVSQMVEPDGWAENGGNTSRMSVVGQKLFVKAPPRVVAQVAWIVDRLNDVGDQHAAARADRDMQAVIRRRQVDEDVARADEAAARKHKADAEAAMRDVVNDLAMKRKAEDETAARADERTALERKRKDEAEAAAGRAGDLRGRGSDAAPAGGAPGGGGPMPKQNHTPGMPGDGALAPLPRGGKRAGSMYAPPRMGVGSQAPIGGGPTADPRAGANDPAGAMPGMLGGTPTADPRARANDPAGAVPGMLGGTPTSDPRGRANDPTGATPGMPGSAPSADPCRRDANPTGPVPGTSGGSGVPSGPSSEPTSGISPEGRADRPGIGMLPTPTTPQSR